MPTKVEVVVHPSGIDIWAQRHPHLNAQPPFPSRSKWCAPWAPAHRFHLFAPGTLPDPNGARPGRQRTVSIFLHRPPTATTTSTTTTTSILASPGGISWLELFWGVGHIYISRPKIIFVDFRFFIDIWAQRHPHLNAQPLSAALSGRAGVTTYWGVLRPRAWRLRFVSRGCLFLIGLGGLAFAMCRSG